MKPHIPLPEAKCIAAKLAEDQAARNLAQLDGDLYAAEFAAKTARQKFRAGLSRWQRAMRKLVAVQLHFARSRNVPTGLRQGPKTPV